MKITEALALAMSQEASDVHITVGNPPAIRVHGELSFMPDVEPFQAETLEEELRELLDPPPNRAVPKDPGVGLLPGPAGHRAVSGEPGQGAK